MRYANHFYHIQLLSLLWTAYRSDNVGVIEKGKDKTMLKKILAVLGIALGISTATDVSLIPFICMGVGLLMLTSEVEEWEQ